MEELTDLADDRPPSELARLVIALLVLVRTNPEHTEARAV
jgi:hypothetical protein